VDEIIQMYADWVKMDFDTNALRKKVNEVQKEISAKKKAKEAADELVAAKKELDTQVEDRKKGVERIRGENEAEGVHNWEHCWKECANKPDRER